MVTLDMNFDPSEVVNQLKPLEAVDGLELPPEKEQPLSLLDEFSPLLTCFPM